MKSSYEKKHGPFFAIKVSKKQARALLQVLNAPGAGSDLNYVDKMALTIVMDDLRGIIRGKP